MKMKEKMKMPELDFDTIEELGNDRVEAIINAMSMEEISAHINSRQMYLEENPLEVPSEKQNRAQLLLVRRLRACREATNKTTKALKKAEAAQPFSLTDLAGKLGK
jgi:hypothetical protein